jgi:hypothetical protein
MWYVPQGLNIWEQIISYNQTPRRDDILRGFVKHQARYVKRADNHDAFNLYARFFDQTAVAR